MINLDDKLGSILSNVRGWKHDDGIRAIPINDAITQIKQAFADEGYHRNKYTTPEEKREYDKLAKRRSRLRKD